MALTLNGSTNTIAGVAVGGLPDGIVDTDMLAANAVVTGKITDGTIVSGDINGGLPAAGLTEADCWIVDSDFSGGSGGLDVTANWIRANAGSGGNLSQKVGTGMSQSSGVWTFPSTGVWYVWFMSQAYDNQSSTYMYGSIIGSPNNMSSTEFLSSGASYLYRDSGNVYEGVQCSYLFDVIDTSNYKVKFRVTGEQNMTWGGHADRMDTGAIFMRLGDT